MYGNKKLLTVVACILIFAMAFVPCRRANAVLPIIVAGGVSIAPEVYVAVASVITACGLYASTQTDLKYAVGDYWQNSSDYIKKKWAYSAANTYMVGKMIIDGALTADVTRYININYKKGVNEVVHNKNVSGSGEVPGGECATVINGWVMSTQNSVRVGAIKATCNGVVRKSSYYSRFIEDVYSYGLCTITAAGGAVFLAYWFKNDKNSEPMVYKFEPDVVLTGPINYSKTVPETRTFVGDGAGFGTALGNRPDVYVPCPPVPPVEWPDRWIDDLERDLNNTTADRYVENMDQDWDWYVDKDGNIYKKPKGEPPKKPDDTKLVPPVPPPYDPVHPEPGEPGPATPDQPWIPADPCPLCPSEPGPAPNCPNPYCPNHPSPQAPPVPDPNTPADPCPYCPPNPDPVNNPCPNHYCPNNPAPVTPPSPKPQVGEPGGPPPKDDRYIDLEPLKKLPHLFTRKFPFSLPWDFFNSFKQLEGGTWDGKIDVNIQSVLADFVFTIDLSMFNNIRHVVMKIELILFDIALILATRRLMGGGV